MFKFVQEQYLNLPVTRASLDGKIVVITGANTGLGYEAAKHIATMNPEKLIIAVRDLEKGNRAAETIQTATGFSKTEVWKLDLCSFESVKSFAAKYNSTFDRLDILISNAGLAQGHWETTSDGYEKMLQVNHLSNMMLILLLVPTLKNTARKYKVEPRVVVLSSEVHAWAPYVQVDEQEPVKALNDKNRSNIGTRYENSKLLNVMMTKSLAKYYPEISFGSLNPGLCSTELGRDASFFRRSFLVFLRLLLARTAEMGSRTLLHAALSDDLLLSHGANGRYWSACHEETSSQVSSNQVAIDNLWNESLKILKGYAPEIAEVK
eukprot:TRINITY_DN2830_c0_g1_i1.p1 TRINITY_DN2830_c0_g1~~TRINITY_DN2830_c0_g1_i1.p1  ORF type:complete len:321 (+),score=51.36 TRINITY_DN2830_c0_g1_i1:59-1021(+)